jgi:hypothetical protein
MDDERSPVTHHVPLTATVGFTAQLRAARIAGLGAAIVVFAKTITTRPPAPEPGLHPQAQVPPGLLDAAIFGLAVAATYAVVRTCLDVLRRHP